MGQRIKGTIEIYIIEINIGVIERKTSKLFFYAFLRISLIIVPKIKNLCVRFIASRRCMHYLNDTRNQRDITFFFNSFDLLQQNDNVYMSCLSGVL